MDNEIVISMVKVRVLPDSVIIKLDALRKRRDEIEMLLSAEDTTKMT